MKLITLIVCVGATVGFLTSCSSAKPQHKHDDLLFEPEIRYLAQSVDIKKN